MAKKIYNLNTERIKRNCKKRLEAKPDKTIDDPDEIIDKSVIKFTEFMIKTIPKLVDQLKSAIDTSLDELTRAVKEANKKK